MRIITCGGKRQRLFQWAKELGVAPSTILSRLDRGWSVQETLTTPKTASLWIKRDYPAEYNAWSHLIRRCNNPNNNQYRNYGGRGITVSPLFLYSFKRFLEEIGPRPSSKHSVDRINNNGHYVHGNIRWATQTQQANNSRKVRSIKFQGEVRNLKQWAKKLHIRPSTLHTRLRLWSKVRALSTIGRVK